MLRALDTRLHPSAENYVWIDEEDDKVERSKDRDCAIWLDFTSISIENTEGVIKDLPPCDGVLSRLPLIVLLGFFEARTAILSNQLKKVVLIVEKGCPQRRGTTTYLHSPPTSRENVRHDEHSERPHAAQVQFIYKHSCILRDSKPSPMAQQSEHLTTILDEWQYPHMVYAVCSYSSDDKTRRSKNLAPDTHRLYNDLLHTTNSCKGPCSFHETFLDFWRKGICDPAPFVSSTVA
ncbi:hypothetical protein TNCV_2762491 [Trichonephila clavipes]|nr:hypothetical protein TNCV_2762491 [Trichonephila clavipes]